MIKYLITIWILLSSSTLFADEVVTTKSGNKINLKEDGTWSFVLKKTSNAINTDSAIAVVDAYLGANEYDDRLKYVLVPERIKILRGDQNSEDTSWEKPIYKIITNKEPRNIKLGQWAKILAKYKYDDNKWTEILYYLKRTNSGYKIDWESSAGYNKLPPKEFNITKPTEPVRVRVLAAIDNYYNYEFLVQSNSMYSVVMYDIDGDLYGHGYVYKDTELGKKIFNSMKNGENHYMVFDIKSLMNGMNGSHFLIHNLVSIDSWLVDN
jgi:hypothetical protein